MECAARTGFFLVRRCGLPAVGACSQCGTPVCRAHVGMFAFDSTPERPKVRSCRPCAARDTPSDLNDATPSSSSGSHSSSDSFSGGNGAFGGGGASESWSAETGTAVATGAAVGTAVAASEAGAEAAPIIAGAEFTDEDFAAFDDVSDFDRKAGNDAYDS